MSASATALCHVIGRVLSVSIAERTYQYSLIYEPGSEALLLLHNGLTPSAFRKAAARNTN
jgi:hypothetical protein